VIRTNLSTRPFYNERIVRLGLVVIALAVLAATAFNVSRVRRYSRSDTQLATQASHDEARAADLRQQAARLRGSVDPKQVDYAAADARQANELIDRRTFSWTELFNRFETTLPDEVRIASVRPQIDRDHGFMLVINVNARSVDDVNTFITNLENTGAFMNIRPASERTDEAGMLQSSLEAVYLPTAGKPAIRGGRR
jgi:Tfp pilus assembly protein PilN